MSAEALRQLAATLVPLAGTVMSLPKNSLFWTYTIQGADGSPYLTRTLLPRLGDRRPLVHQIHRADLDPHPHNHPWREADFLVVDGGYTDERWTRSDGVWFIDRRVLRPGDVNHLAADDFHRVVNVLPGTITFGMVGNRVQNWGFLVDGAVVPHLEYFSSRWYVDQGGLS